MSLKATCACGKSFFAKPELAGKRVRCPGCGGVIQVPALSAPSAEEPFDLGAPINFPGNANPLATPSPFGTPPANPLGYSPSPSPSFSYAPQPASPPGGNKKLIIGLVLGGVGLAFVAGVAVLLLLLLPAVQAARQAADRARARQANPAMPGAPAVPPSGTPSVASGPAWETYTSATGGYSLQLPGRFRTQTQTQPTIAGPLTISTVTVDLPNGGVVMAAHNDLPAISLMAGPDVVLEGGCEGQVRAVNGMLTSKSTIQVGGFPGRELRYSASQAGRQAQVQSRLVLANSRLFQLSWIAPTTSTVPAQDVQKFFDSFTITVAPPAVSAPPTIPGLPPGPPPTGSPPATVPPVATPPTITPPTSPTLPTGLAQLAEPQRKVLYSQVVNLRDSLRKLEESVAAGAKTGRNQAFFADSLKRSKERHEQTLDSLCKAFRISRAELDQLLAEGDQKQWVPGKSSQ